MYPNFSLILQLSGAAKCSHGHLAAQRQLLPALTSLAEPTITLRVEYLLALQGAL